MKIESPKIQTNVPGPGGQPGFLLIVPRNEALEWDINYEVVSTSRYWMQERQAWWIAAPYLHTAEEIVRRYQPSPPPRQVTIPQVALPVEAAPAALAAAPKPGSEPEPVPEPAAPAVAVGWMAALRTRLRGFGTRFRKNRRSPGSRASPPQA